MAIFAEEIVRYVEHGIKNGTLVEHTGCSCSGRRVSVEETAEETEEAANKYVQQLL